MAGDPRVFRADDEVVPSTNLLLSLRALGYSFNSAVADLVDNSISARATQIWIDFGLDPEPYVAILDDGCGMTPERLKDAMRLGGTSGSVRDEDDLGRFGLGLKTASLSQAKTLRVLSKCIGGVMAGRSWDINLIVETGRWLSPVISRQEQEEIPLAERLSYLESGTLVVWTDLDQLIEATQEPQEAILENFQELNQHLSLIFHRFLSGEANRKIEIFLGEKKVQATDPFLRSHKATQQLPVDSVLVDGQTLKISPFILPHVSKLSAKDRELAQIDGSMRENQGFYIYRNDRIIGQSSWFRLARKSEMTKFARGAIDVPNSLDSQWKLDIKKSSAVPPESVKQVIRRVLDKFTETSARIGRFRGRDVNQDQQSRVWKVRQTREGFEYKLNRDHPAISSTAQRFGKDYAEFEAVLQLVEAMIPAQDIHNRMSADSNVNFDEFSPDELVTLASKIIPIMEGNSAEEKQIRLLSIEPFSTSLSYQETLRARWEEVAPHA
jgi:hypothetical protein